MTLRSSPAYDRSRSPKWAVTMRRNDRSPSTETTGHDRRNTQQGFELHVLRGLEPWLLSRADWLLKMEFAPDWLRSQGTDPRSVLDHLQSRYDFIEFPERIPYGTPSTASLFAYPLQVCDHRAFIEYVVSLNKAGTGWVDLLVRPRAA